MADFTFLDVLNEIERGIKGVFNMGDGKVEYVDTPEQFKLKFKEFTDSKFRLANHIGNYMKFDLVKSAISDYTPVQQYYKDALVSNVKKDIISEGKVDFIMTVAVGLASKKGLSGAELEAVKGYVISKLSSLDGRIKKYYGDNWERYLTKGSVVEKFIINFLKKYLNNGIDEIASVYANNLGKGNYLNRNAGMTHMMNVNYTPVVQDQDAIIDTGEDPDMNSDPYRRELNRVNDMKDKRKAPKGLYEDSSEPKELKY